MIPKYDIFIFQLTLHICPNVISSVCISFSCILGLQMFAQVIDCLNLLTWVTTIHQRPHATNSLPIIAVLTCAKTFVAKG